MSRSQEDRIGDRDYEVTIKFRTTIRALPSEREAQRVARGIGNRIARLEAGTLEAVEVALVQRRRANDEEEMKLVTGTKYIVRYQSETQRYQRQAVMVYLGPTPEGDGYLFSARPVAGTQKLPKSWIKGVWKALLGEKIRIDERVFENEEIFAERVW